MNDSRSVILDKLKPGVTGSLPPMLPDFSNESASPVEDFKKMLTSIGGAVIDFQDFAAVKAFIKDNYKPGTRVVSCVTAIDGFEDLPQSGVQPQSLDDVHLAVLSGEFAVAENGAIWLTEASLPHRVLPFITEHLLVIISRNAILRTMHDAYDRIGDASYGFGIFIGGPSKTADIEQSLVLGAHGPKSMTVALM